jgi:hypothetical protein
VLVAAALLAEAPGHVAADGPAQLVARLGRSHIRGGRVGQEDVGRADDFASRSRRARGSRKDGEHGDNGDSCD